MSSPLPPQASLSSPSPPCYLLTPPPPLFLSLSPPTLCDVAPGVGSAHRGRDTCVPAHVPAVAGGVRSSKQERDICVPAHVPAVAGGVAPFKTRAGHMRARSRPHRSRRGCALRMAGETQPLSSLSLRCCGLSLSAWLACFAAAYARLAPACSGARHARGRLSLRDRHASAPRASPASAPMWWVTLSDLLAADRLPPPLRGPRSALRGRRVTW